jgi:hypothetical protein
MNGKDVFGHSYAEAGKRHTRYFYCFFFTIQINSCPCAYSFLIFFKCCSLSDVTNAHVLADLLCGPCDRLNLD